MRSSEKVRKAVLLPNGYARVLKEMMRKFTGIPDVNAAAIVNADGSVVSWHSNLGEEPSNALDYMLDIICQDHQRDANYYKQGMFCQSVIDCTEHKILLSKVSGNVFLLLLLDKSAYIGLTMLDMEGCLRVIDKILKECAK